MTDQTWSDIRSQLAHQYGDELPGPGLETELVTMFENHPTTFTAEAARAATAYRDGKIRSPWAILKSNLAERITNDQKFASVTANTATEREHAIRRAERWINHAGMFFPTASDLTDDLFGQPATTPTVEFLEALEIDTRENAGRSLFDGLLKASIRRTRDRGQQTTYESSGPLTAYDTPELRQHFADLWEALQPAAIAVLQAARARLQPASPPSEDIAW